MSAAPGYPLRPAVDVVFDCNICLRSVVSPRSPAAACFSLLGTEAVTVFVSGDVLDEVENVLSRPQLRQKFPLLTQDSKKALIQVTYDKDLLDLMRETEEGRDFRHRFPRLEIVDPLTFLKALGVLGD